MSYRPFIPRPPKFLHGVTSDALACSNDPLYEINHPEERWLLLIPGVLEHVIGLNKRIAFELVQSRYNISSYVIQDVRSRGSTYNFTS